VSVTEQFRIFLAEDNPADVYLIREALDQAGLQYSLDVAENGEIASRRIHNYVDEGTRPALMILDLNLPRLSGGELLSIVRNTEVLKEVPVVVFTSSDSPHDRDLSARLGATLHLRKPSKLEDFLSIGSQFRDLALGSTKPAAGH
jgi:two-component system, chemotaxis family, response regulator Rcp1